VNFSETVGIELLESAYKWAAELDPR
jgi:hypothetical protein